MRAIVQRVSEACVRIDDSTVGAIGTGFLVYLGVGRDDDRSDVAYIASKVRDLRVFGDADGKMNRSLADVGGAILAVSQFTLYGDCRNGRRPSFIAAAGPDVGRARFDAVVEEWRGSGLDVETGTFRAHMMVESINDGPVTILLDSRKGF